MSVTLERRGNVALAIIDRPPVNAIDSSVRAGLINAVTEASNDSSVAAIVIVCRGRTFLSGADLTELASGIQPPPYRETLSTIENCAKPVIAALHGTALGGGLEIAMACHYRCATATARVGLPEITLGLVPGAGGTQRLPRLVGAIRALEMLIDGAPISASRAVEIGLIDTIVGEDIIEAAERYARELIAAHAPPRPAYSRSSQGTELDAAAVEAVLNRAARALKGRTTQHAVVRAIRAAIELPFDRGLDLEAQISAETLDSLESRALRHVFFAERECARIPDLTAGTRPAEIQRAAVVGAGTMGRGIAIALADAGLPTRLIEREQGALDLALRSIHEHYESAARRGRMDKSEIERRMGRISGGVALEAAADASVVIEAVFEDMALKCSVLERLDAIVPDSTILASNTSSLSVTQLAAGTKHPDRVLGLHFFSPANVMRLLEIVRGRLTSEQTLQTGLALAKLLRKVGVVVGDGFGFVGNRMMLDGYFRESELMLLQGVAPERIDAVMEEFGFAMGPNRVNDLAGIDVGTKVRIELAKREPRAAPYHVVSDALTALGRLGQKSGSGVYRYASGDRTPIHDEAVDALTAQLAKQYSIAPREVSNVEIEQRCVLSLINIGANILAEDLAYRASDIDVVWTSGYGFPRWRGGPMFHADSLGLANVVDGIRAMASTGGGEYWRVSPLLLELAESGGTFADWDRKRRG
jgi:3-hydroxyacyl-CoA dehydrogenase